MVSPCDTLAILASKAISCCSHRSRSLVHVRSDVDGEGLDNNVDVDDDVDVDVVDDVAVEMDEVVMGSLEESRARLYMVDRA